MRAQPLTGGFDDAPRQSARAFRVLLDAMARPGTWRDLVGARPPTPLSPAAGAALLTLADPGTPLHLAGALDCAELRGWIGFHCGAPIVAARDATLAVGAWADLQPLERFAIGTAEYPDRSATLIVELGHRPDPNARLTGPGINGEIRAFCPGARPAQFPLGLDLFLTAGSGISGLPRSTKVEFF